VVRLEYDVTRLDHYNRALPFAFSHKRSAECNTGPTATRPRPAFDGNSALSGRLAPVPPDGRFWPSASLAPERFARDHCRTWRSGVDPDRDGHHESRYPRSPELQVARNRFRLRRLSSPANGRRWSKPGPADEAGIRLHETSRRPD